jgi:putative nucleotidyltransferase with HDIG domain
MENEEMIRRTREFVKQAFIEHPHYSFGHWSVMYDHSCKVEELAMKIAEEVECDRLLVVLASLLHDIGKTHRADEETLHREHESFNLAVSEDFLESLGLPSERLVKLKRLISYEDDSVEMQVVRDADAMALPADKRLYMLFIKWADRKKLESSIERKLEKFQKLHFAVSRDMSREWFEMMKRDWEDYRKNNSSEH